MNANLKSGLGPYYRTFVVRNDGQTYADRNLWGNYSATVVDPVNNVDFWTIQPFADLPAMPGTVNGNGEWGVQWAKVAVDDRPIIQSMGMNSGGLFTMTVKSRFGATYSIEASDLLSAAWVPVGTGTGIFNFIDQDRNNFPFRRFYRMRETTGGGGGMAMMGGGPEGGGGLAAMALGSEGTQGSGGSVVSPAGPAQPLPTWQRPAAADTRTQEQLRQTWEAFAADVRGWLDAPNLSGTESNLYERMLDSAVQVLDGLGQ